jgi:GNAT superfamily N-acetyltransferase
MSLFRGPVVSTAGELIMADGIVIARAKPSDAMEIADLYLSARAEALPFLGRTHSDEDVRIWVRDHLLLSSETYVAMVGDQIVGFISLEQESIEQLYVRPGWYRCGIGSLLLNKAFAESRGRLQLFTFQRNIAARAFYEAKGFRALEFTDGSRNEEREPDIRYVWDRESLELCLCQSCSRSVTTPDARLATAAVEDHIGRR